MGFREFMKMPYSRRKKFSDILIERNKKIK